MIAQALFSNKQNVINVYSENFNSQLSYEVLVKSKWLCLPTAIVDVINVSFCRNLITFTFDLPCLDKGDYSLIIRDKNDISVIVLTQNALV